MIIPTKHQNIKLNPMVLGADILFLLRKEDFTMEELYQSIKITNSIDLDSFYDTITYLWLIEAITIDKNKISKKNNVS
ncbi:ABC-three component system middle component 6 [Kordia sp.]|uniref:ABC-three component system middle component 6 n=1 Tax=Kordia sp. TaxID=1965332 RepID=UPI003B5CE8DA